MTKMKLLTSAALFIALFLCATLSRVDAGKSKGRRNNSRRSYVAAPTYAPVLNAGINPTTEAPTFVPVMEATTKEPTFNIPGTSTWYSFTTSPAAMPVMNAATDAPVDGATQTPSREIVTFSPRPTTYLSPNSETTTLAPALYPSDQSSPSLSPNRVTTTLAPSLYPSYLSLLSSNPGYEFTTPPVLDFPTLNAQTTTSTPSSATTLNSMEPTISNTLTITDLLTSDFPSLPPSRILETATKSPSSSGNSQTGENSTAGVNETELCSSTSGAFFFTGEDNNTEPFKLDVFTFAYELETFPRVSAEDALPSLEIAVVDSLLSLLFPYKCDQSSRRLVTSSNVVGISAEPADEATAVECEPEVREKNRCEFVEGKISIFTTDGETDAVMDAIEETLSESMNRGDFNDASSGIARVGYSTDKIPDEGTQGGDGLHNGGENNTVKPATDENGSMLGIGLSLSFAGVLLFIVGASAYRRKRKVGDQDASTLQDGVTVNGLNRFDAPSTEDSYMPGNGDFKVMPLSPAAERNVDNNRFSAYSGIDVSQE